MNGCDWRRARNAIAVTLVGLYVVSSAAQELEQTQALPFIPSASDVLGRQGFVRVINHSAEAGEVRIDAIDDEGESYGAISLDIGAGEVVHFNSDDLENGNAEKGLSDGVGAGEGAWRLELSSELDIEVLSYVRTVDGFLTSMHDTVPSDGGRHRVAFFNPGSNTSQMSRLRLVNPGEEPAEVSITGVGDRGGSPGSEVTTTIPAGASRTFTAAALESGGEGLEGALGDGVGKWRLTVESGQPLVVMSLLIDPMGRLTNLSTARSRIRPSAPDLVVVSSVSNRRPVVGATFTLSATVRNDGDAASPVTVLRYHRSTDERITVTDRAVGTDAVAGLAASGSVSASVELSAPPTPGTYYYGACVDAVGEERDATNNCSTAIEVYVQESESVSQGLPDLTVAPPTVSDGGPGVGTTFFLSVTVKNAGDGAAPSAMVRYFQSPDETISTTDTPAGSDTVVELGVFGSGSKSVELTAPSTPGVHFYGACVDAVAKESDTTNNCSPSVELNVPRSEPQTEGHPDLSIAALVVALSPAGTYPNDAFTLSATVSNSGEADAAATTLRYYRSTDSTISTSDTEVDTDEVAGLAASASGSELVDLTAPSTPGTYYYGACVDAVEEESDMTNNCSTSRQIEVLDPERPPDLVVASPSVSDDGPVAGETFTLSMTVRNDGDGDSAATTLRYYRSADATVTTSDTEVGTDAVTGLAASASSDESVEVTAPAVTGTYYYGACVDEVAEESDATDNCSPSVRVDVREPPPTRPNLEVGMPTVDDTSLETSAHFRLSVTVSNTGNRNSAATTLRWYRSTDATITTSDTDVGTDSVRLLATDSGRDTSIESIALTAPSTAGTYYYGACVDAVTDESDTTDNCSASVRVDVVEPTMSPDLVAGSPAVDDASPEMGATITLSATVSNTGDRDSAATTLRFYRSVKRSIEPTDTWVGSVAVGTLAASGGSSGALSLSLTAPSTAGTYYYGACVDAVAGESDTTNNCTQSLALTVDGPPPDLVVGRASVTEIREDGTFWLAATVRNQGAGGSAAATVRYYRSTDGTITTSDTTVGTDEAPTLIPSAGYGATINLTAPTSSGTYYYGVCVDEVPRESDTTNNCSVSVRVEVGGPPPDLVVLAPSVSAINETYPLDGTFSLVVTVRNQGGGTAAATTVRYYRSTDGTITTSDTELHTGPVNRLSTLGTSEATVLLTAPTTAGTYYYGACVDAVARESDTTNNCSSAASLVVN